MSDRPIGPLILVVGPSGAGKDTILKGARATLAASPFIYFPRREITRAPGGAEDCIPVREADFEWRRNAGAYCLSWRAHGLCYGIPRDVTDHLVDGRAVAVNVSRSVIDDAVRSFRSVAVVHVTASPDVLRKRLAARRRETAEEIARRLDREAARSINAPRRFDIVNDGHPADAITAFVRALERIHPTLQEDRHPVNA